MLASLILALAAQPAPPPAPSPVTAPVAGSQGGAAAPPAAITGPPTEGFAFCREVGPHPLAIVSVKGPSARVRKAPLVVAVSEEAPQVVVPRHVDDRWPAIEVKSACLTREPPTLPERPDVDIQLDSSAQLVFGCRADPVGAMWVSGHVLAALTMPPAENACLTQVDVRPPCPARFGEDDATFESRLRQSTQETRARLARLVPRYPHGGPALFVTVRAPRKERARDRLFLVERLLEPETCGCAEDAAHVTSTRVRPLRVPALPDATLLTIAVPRYVGAAYDLVLAPDEDELDAESETRLAYTDTFSALPPDNERALRVFSAPETCPCDCEDW